MQTRGVPPDVVAGKYRIGRLLGGGGAGAVYRARDPSSQTEAAVKIIPASDLPDEAARMQLAEHGRTVAGVRHPAIVPVIDSGVLPDGNGYVVMELVDGEDLRSLLLREGTVEAAHTAAIVSSVAEGLEAAHRTGMLHLDLKPENILLPAVPAEAVARLVDFSAPGALVMGTPAYMAPEQLRGEAVDARSDVFALGVIAYEMLSGRLPFGRGSAADVVLAQARGVPSMDAGLPAALARAIRAALDEDADRRPATPQAFAHLVSASAGA